MLIKHMPRLFFSGLEAQQCRLRKNIYVYVYFRLKYLIIINILIQNLFFSFVQKEGIWNEFVHFLSLVHV